MLWSCKEAALPHKLDCAICLRAFVRRCRIVSDSFATFLSSAAEGALACLYLISDAPLCSSLRHPCFHSMRWSHVTRDLPRSDHSPLGYSPHLDPVQWLRLKSPLLPPRPLPRWHGCPTSAWVFLVGRRRWILKLSVGAEGRCDGTTMTKRNETSSHTTRPQLLLRPWRKAARPRPPKCGGGAHWRWLERHVR